MPGHNSDNIRAFPFAIRTDHLNLPSRYELLPGQNDSERLVGRPLDLSGQFVVLGIITVVFIVNLPSPLYSLLASLVKRNFTLLTKPDFVLTKPHFVTASPQVFSPFAVSPTRREAPGLAPPGLASDHSAYALPSCLPKIRSRQP